MVVLPESLLSPGPRSAELWSSPAAPPLGPPGAVLASPVASGGRRVGRDGRFVRGFPRVPDGRQVVGLSNVGLTEDRAHVLSLEPGFCPAPSGSGGLGVLEDACGGMGGVGLREFFLQDGTPARLPAGPGFCRGTCWCPSGGGDGALHACCSAIAAGVGAFGLVPSRGRNINRRGRGAIRGLRRVVEERKICIIPADGGGAVVVQGFSGCKR